MGKIRILLIESSPIVVQGLQALIQSGGRMEVVAVAHSLERIQERLVLNNPDVVILNPLLLDYSKRLIFRSLFQDKPNMPILALVYSYFDKQWLGSFDGVIEIEDDRFHLEKKIEEVVSAANGRNDNLEVYELSDREREVLIELAKGLMNKEIAAKLHISIHTVVTHRKNIVRKTGIKSAAGLAVYALLNNLLEERDLETVYGG
ncbi:MAG: response regulator transcription factor [Bacteroidales bacterium]|nr:response regulator transcription factor [Bacteroidales bacterium]